MRICRPDVSRWFTGLELAGSKVWSSESPRF
nr:MAG TPA: hypothetical protein [Caudoviricetes sp.]